MAFKFFFVHLAEVVLAFPDCELLEKLIVAFFVNEAFCKPGPFFPFDWAECCFCPAVIDYLSVISVAQSLGPTEAVFYAEVFVFSR